MECVYRMSCLWCFFFFSSRRRHTRFDCDWSSDVCSSDLMFDCVLPTRLARNGTAFTSTGAVNLKNAEFTLDKSPIEENCACYACSEFSRGYIRHLIKAEEILGLRLITLHNLHFYLDLMRRAQAAIENGNFHKFRKAFVSG